MRPATATPESCRGLRETFGDRRITPGRVTLELPGSRKMGVVPVTVTVDSAMSAQDYVKSIHLFREEPLPRVLDVQPGHRARPRLLRIRVATLADERRCGDDDGTL